MVLMFIRDFLFGFLPTTSVRLFRAIETFDLLAHASGVEP
jgi:hypothetical protein